jgi:hypothetical protein
MMMQMVGAFAEFERAMIKERTPSAGLAAARAEGRIGGRRKKLDPAKRRVIAESVLSGKTGAEMARSTTSVRRPCPASSPLTGRDWKCPMPDDVHELLSLDALGRKGLRHFKQIVRRPP